MRLEIQKIVEKCLKNAFDLTKEVLVDIPRQSEADYSVNTALQCSKELWQSPKQIAEILVEEIKKENSKLFSNIGVFGPGFIYFTLSKSVLSELLDTENLNWGNGTDLEDKNIMVEYACPNTHKAFHIWHLRNISLGESLIRFYESQGAKIFRANYQGDIGLHVAKCLWALQKSEIHELKTPQDKAEFLGKVYAVWWKAYEKDDNAKAEIHTINKELYNISANISTNTELQDLYNKSRQWSLDYFEYIYKRLYSTFDHLFFESQTWNIWKQLVEKNIGDIFTESDGAVIFEGEKHGLHTRVFITKEGNPTYEWKELGLAKMEKEIFNYDKNLHIVANEQNEYFKVIFEAMFQIFPDLKEKQKHISYWMVKLPNWKMSSRTGDVITAEWLLNEAKNKIISILSDRDFSDKDKENIAEIVAVGALKFSMLHTQAKNDITFDIDNAVRFDWDSGPYIQYAYARINSILNKVENSNFIWNYVECFNEFDWKLLKKIQYFPYFVSRCAKENTPHYLSHYLLKLVAEFSSWYGKNSVVNADNENIKQARIKLLILLQKTVKNWLYLMWIKVPEKM